VQRNKSSDSVLHQLTSSENGKARPLHILSKTRSTTYINPNQSEKIMYNSKVTLTLRRSKSRLQDMTAGEKIGGGERNNGHNDEEEEDAMMEVDNFSQAGQRMMPPPEKPRVYFGQQSDPGPMQPVPAARNESATGLGLNVPAMRRAEALRILSPTPPPLCAKPVLQHAVRPLLFSASSQLPQIE